MDEMTKRRKQRLAELLKAPPFNGNRQDFLIASGLSKGRITQMLDPDQPFGEISAMRLAKKLQRKCPELKDERWFEKTVVRSSTSSSSDNVRVTNVTDRSPGDGLTNTSDIQWDANKEIPTAMPYAPERLKSAVLLMGSLLGALDDRSRKIIGGLLNEMAEKPDEASYFAGIAVSAAKTQKPLTDNAALERALRPHAHTD